MTQILTPVTLFKALADDTRLRIALLVTREQELCVCELTCALDLSQPKISRHLAQLRGAEILADRRQGQWVYYRLHPQLPEWARTLLHGTLAANLQWLKGDAARLQDMGERPARQISCC